LYFCCNIYYHSRPLSLWRITMSGLLLGVVLSAFTCWFHNMVTLLHEFFIPIMVHAHAELLVQFTSTSLSSAPSSYEADDGVTRFSLCQTFHYLSKAPWRLHQAAAQNVRLFITSREQTSQSLEANTWSYAASGCVTVR
jgi:hypothetical protein